MSSLGGAIVWWEERNVRFICSVISLIDCDYFFKYYFIRQTDKLNEMELESNVSKTCQKHTPFDVLVKAFLLLHPF